MTITFHLRTRIMCALTAAFCAALSLDADANDWPRYLGPQFNLTSTETNWVSQWPEKGPKILWRAHVGIGASSVATSNGRLYTMGNVNNKDTISCLDALTGKVAWQHAFDAPLEKRQFEGGPAATPTVSGDRVFTLNHQGKVHCLNAQTGAVIWQKNVVSDFSGSQPRWGYAGSPLVDGDLVILDIGGPSHSTVALNKTDGSLVWRNGRDRAGYASPVPFTHQDTRGVMVFKARDLVAINLGTGEELWRHPWKTSWDVNATTPVVAGSDLVFVSTGYGVGCALIKLQDGKPVEAWKNNALATQFNTPVVAGNHVYGIHGSAGKGELKCLSLQTGEVRWTYPDVGCGSLMLAGDRLIVLGEQGDLIIGKASPDEFIVQARARVLTGRCWVVPVLSNGLLYCRDNTGNLIALDLRPE
jgi:outer membrane protein assembly factor BamB